ncbi:MAG: Xaa-Pro peptidase family protein [Nitrospinota bacterium]
MQPPYDNAKLNRLMDEAGIDLILAHTPHNIRYLSGGYYFHFRERIAAIGPSQYLPFVGIPKDDSTRAFQVAWLVEASPRNEIDVWIPDVIHTKARGTVGAAQTAAEAIRIRGLTKATIGIERAFMPVDAMDALREELPDAHFVESFGILEELRVIKRPDELEILCQVGQSAAEAIQEGFRLGATDATTEKIARTVEGGMVQRGIHFHYVFTAAGPGMRREPSEKKWERGEILHIDSGGSQAGYMADICRMGSRGEPSLLADEIYRACLHIVDKTRAAMKPGVDCGTVYRIGQSALQETGHAENGFFLVHGIGMVQQELPRFSPDEERPLEAGMIVSVENDIRHPEVGFVKIEDTVAITEEGCEGLSDLGRDTWAIVD